MKENLANIINPYFSHDLSARQDSSIIKLMMDLGWSGYGLFWAIVELMHKNSFAIDDEKIIAYELRTDVEKIHKIMTEYDLFRTENGFYISDRIQRNLNYTESKNEEKRIAAKTRWLLSSFNKSYKEFFNEEPILDSSEIEKLKKMSEKVPDLKEKLRDIIYTLKKLKFDNDYKPCANWLLKDNNMAKILNGEFGPLKHKKTQKEIKEEERQYQQNIQRQKEPDELELEISKITSKDGAFEFIKKYYSDKKITFVGAKALVVPPIKTMMNKFEIQDDDLKDLN